jgi:hypothetical protein
LYADTPGAPENAVARHDDDAPAPPGAHGRQHRACEREHAEEVGLHDPPDLAVGQVFERGPRAHARVVHDGVERVVRGAQHLAHRAVDGFGVGDVERQHVEAVCGNAGVDPCLVESVPLLQVAHGGEHLPPAGSKRDRGGEAEPARASGDENGGHPISPPTRRRRG